MKRRTVLGGIAVAAPALWSLRCAAESGSPEPADRAALPDFRRPEDLDDSDAFRRAAATGRTVYLPAGGGRGPDGRYLIASAPTDRLSAGTRVVGDGIDRTVIARSYRRRTPFVFFHDSGSADPARNLRSIAFSDLTIEDEVAKRGYSEYEYLIMLNGVSGARFERVGFRGFRGDALHLGSGTTLGDERHNADIEVRDCVFDGVNANNRNAISVIDCDGLLIERSRFLNCSRYGDGTLNQGDPFNPRTGVVAPGPIDFEPNDDGFAVIKRVTIRGNVFRGGGGHAVALNLRANDRLRQPQRDFAIHDNVIEDRDGGFTSAGFGGDGALTATQAYDISIARNVVRRCRTPFIFNGLRGVDLTDNQFIDCGARAEIGNNAGNALVTLRGNRFLRCGSKEAGYALWIRGSDRVTLERNEFNDCGLADGTVGVAIAFVAGRITNLRVTDNLFASPTGRMTQVAVAFREAALDPRTATIGRQRVTFQAPTLLEALRLPAS